MSCPFWCFCFTIKLKSAFPGAMLSIFIPIPLEALSLFHIVSADFFARSKGVIPQFHCIENWTCVRLTLDKILTQFFLVLFFVSIEDQHFLTYKISVNNLVLKIGRKDG